MENARHVCASALKVEEADVEKLLTRIEDSPASGKALRDAPENIAGMVRRFHVGGRRGHRLIYLFVPSKNVGMPIYLSEDIKSNIDYDEIPWGEMSQAIYEDYVEKRYDKFLNYNP